MFRVTMSIGLLLFALGVGGMMSNRDIARATLPVAFGVALLMAGAAIRWGQHRRRARQLAMAIAAVGAVAALFSDRILMMATLIVYVAFAAQSISRSRPRRRKSGSRTGFTQ